MRMLSLSMLNKLDLEQLLDDLSMPVRGRELVRKARKDGPVRAVRSNGGNVKSIFASRKMDREINTESRNYEFAAAVNFEFDESILEFYPQPCTLRMELIDPTTGEIHDIQHTPDFLCIAKDAVILIECKSEAKLSRLSSKYPWRFKKSSDGQFYAPLIEEYFAQLGIGYRLLTEAALPPRRVENLLHISDYLHPAAEPCPDTVLKEITELLNEHGHVFVDELIGPEHGISVDHINKAIADKQLLTDYDTEKLTEPSKCRVFRDACLMKFLLLEEQDRSLNAASNTFVVDVVAGAEFTYEGQVFKIELAGDSTLVVSDEKGENRNLTTEWLLEAVQAKKVSMRSQRYRSQLHNYSIQSLQAANKRLEQIQSSTPSCSMRTLARYAKAQRSAQLNDVPAVYALVPQTHKRGNRTERLSEVQRDLMAKVFKEHWATNAAKNYKACHRELLVLCNNSNEIAPSYPTLIKYINSNTTKLDNKERHGKRMAYQMGAFVDVLHADSPQHGSRAFQYVHLDHTQVDIELISSKTGKNLGRPWLSIAVDAFTRRILAMYLTYDPPSGVSVFMLIRDMLRRYARLPEFMVVDNGKDLVSSDFRLFLFQQGVHLRMRPAGMPRHGAVLERLFGRVHSEYIHNLGHVEN